MTLFVMKQTLKTLSDQIASVRQWITENTGNPETSMEDIQTKVAERDELQQRYDLLKAEHDQMEEAQRNSMAMSGGGAANEEEVKVKAVGTFYRAALTGGDVSKAYEGLGGIPVGTADLGYGEKLLPTNLSNQLILEPLETNSLRSVCRVTNITGLEEPKLGFSIDSADIADVTDQQTANEIEMTGDSVVYGRHKVKVKATVKDTILHGTEVDLVASIENALRSALALREKTYAFLASSDTTHDHMSFYLNSITEVQGADIIEAITNAWADLPDMFSERAVCVMRKQDYYAAVRTLANNSIDLWGKKPEDVLGIPVIFNDKATTPVVGDFSYYGINYDIGTIYETDKDVNKGEYYFVLTAWGDQQIRLKSAFRLAKVTEGP